MIYSNTAMNTAIAEYVHNVQYRIILQLRFCDGETYERIAEQTNYSTQHVKYICNQYKGLLMSRL